MYKKILVPLDGSPTSERGFEEAVALARVMQSSLVLVHVIDIAPVAVDMAPTTTWQDIAEGLRKRGQGLLDRARQTATEHGVTSETRLVEGRAEPVASAIVDAARSTRCDLVVMGTHGRRGFSHALLGSDAERVLRQCPVPVLLVRHPDAAKA
jgi:nucleotide-binding universal stress UspA family protein